MEDVDELFVREVPDLIILLGAVFSEESESSIFIDLQAEATLTSIT